MGVQDGKGFVRRLIALWLRLRWWWVLRDLETIARRHGMGLVECCDSIAAAFGPTHPVVEELAELAELPADVVSAVLRAWLRLVHCPDFPMNPEDTFAFVVRESRQSPDVINLLTAARIRLQAVVELELARRGADAPFWR